MQHAVIIISYTSKKNPKNWYYVAYINVDSE